MNSLGVALVWCVIQVTILAAVACGAYALVRRVGPPARSLAALAGLFLIVPLTLFAFSPWPRWSLAARAVESHKVSRVDPSSSAAVGGRGSNAEDAPIGKAAGRSADEDSSSAAAIFFEALVSELRRAPSTAANQSWQWPATFAALFVLGGSLGLLRLGAGLAAVRSYRAGAKQIVDPALRELLDVLQAELACVRPVAVCESERLATAATIGWRRPLVILPAGWKEWSIEELRAVLAHEIAHVARHDFATWAAAQLALVFHFYHPLVHWLAGRLRLEQELAADAAAAQLVGGSRSYLTTLAGMALRQSDRPLAWPARTFLPTRGTFMRRIEMLRDETPLATKLSPSVRVGLLAVLTLASLAVAGLRGAADERQQTGKESRALAAADESGAKTRARPARTTSSTGSSASSGSSATSTTSGSSSASTSLGRDPLSLAYVPRDAAIVAALRPADLLGLPVLAGVKKALAEVKEPEPGLGVRFERIEQATSVLLVDPGTPPAATQPAFILRLTQAADVPALLGALQPDPQEEEYGGQKYIRNKDGRGPFCFRPDERTVVVCGREEHLRRMIVADKNGASKAKWAQQWQAIADSAVAVIVQTPAIRAMIPQPPGPGAANPLSAFGPLWLQTSSVALSVDLDKQLTVALSLTASAPTDVQKVRDTLAAALTLGQNSLSQARDMVSRQPGQEGAVFLRLLDTLDATLDAVKIEQEGVEVRAKAQLGADEASAIAAMLVPAVHNAREAARRSQSKNNLKQLGLAMYNYQEANKSFPAAVLYGPDGKTPYSWRVALLPFLDQQALYDQYKFDEPWDSENNKQVLAQMPPVFRDANDPASSTFASYFRLTGTSRQPEREGAGLKLADILDGTSNTIALVEAKRDIPWTRPEDIPYAAGKLLPKFGGRHPGIFLALFFDGSVHAISQQVEDRVLRALITPDGGEPVTNLPDALR